MNFTKTLVNVVASSLVAISIAHAQVDLNVSSDVSNINVGESVNVTVSISGLGDMTPDSLGLFDFGVSFDSDTLSFTGADFGDPVLGGSQLDTGNFGSFTESRPGDGVVELTEISLEDPGDLNSMQPGAFTLATLSFDAIGAGTSSFDIVATDFFGAPEISLFDAEIPGSPLMITMTQGGGVTVSGGASSGGNSVTPTPEPGSLILLSTLLSTGAFYGWRRKEQA